MYNVHETTMIEPEREFSEKRQDDDRKTKQKMELIRSKLKTHARKVRISVSSSLCNPCPYFQDILPNRPPSATKSSKTNLIHHHRRNILIDTSSNLSTNGDNSSGTSSLEQQQHSQPRIVPYKFSSSNLFNTYNIFAAAAIGRGDFLHEEDSEDEEDSHDEDDDQQTQIEQQHILSSSSPPPPPPAPVVSMNSKRHQLLTSRSFSPSFFYQKKHHHYEQEPSKNTLYHSRHQDRMAKNLPTHRDSSNTMLTTNYPSVTLGKSTNLFFLTHFRNQTMIVFVFFKGPVSQETAITTTTTTTASKSSENDTGVALVDYAHRASPSLHKQQVPTVSTVPRKLSATMNKRLSTSDEATVTHLPSSSDNQEEKISSNSEILYQQSDTSPMLELIDDDVISPTNGLTSAASLRDEKLESFRKQTADNQSRNDTSLSKPVWTDDDDQLILGDEYAGGERTSTSQSTLFRHRNSSTSTTIATPIPTFPSVTKKSTGPSTTQQFYHRHKPSNSDQQSAKSSPRPLIPLSLSKYRRIPANVHLTTTSQQQVYTNTSNTPSNDLTSNGNNTPDTFNDHLMLNKRIEILKTPGKQQQPPQSTAPSPSLSSTPMFSTASSSSKKHFQQQHQDVKTTAATATTAPPPPSSSSSSSLIPLDNAKVTIGMSHESLSISQISNSSFCRNYWTENSHCITQTKCND